MFKWKAVTLHSEINTDIIFLYCNWLIVIIVHIYGINCNWLCYICSAKGKTIMILKCRFADYRNVVKRRRRIYWFCQDVKMFKYRARCGNRLASIYCLDIMLTWLVKCDTKWHKVQVLGVSSICCSSCLDMKLLGLYIQQHQNRHKDRIDGIAQDCRLSKTANALELLQSSTKPIYWFFWP